MNRSTDRLPGKVPPREAKWEQFPFSFRRDTLPLLLWEEARASYEVRRRWSDRKVFLALGIVVGWMGCLYLGPAFRGLVQGFLLGLF